MVWGGRDLQSQNCLGWKGPPVPQRFEVQRTLQTIQSQPLPWTGTPPTAQSTVRSCGLEETSQGTISHRSPGTAQPNTGPRPHAPCPQVPPVPPGLGVQLLPRATIPELHNPPRAGIFPYTQPTPPPGKNGDHFLMSRPSQLRKIKMQPTGCSPIRYQLTQSCWPSPNPTSLATTQCGLVGQLEAVGPTDRHPTWLC